MKTFVIGDIHGNHKALVQCLQRSGFNYDEDLLIQLGDIVDGWHETRECIDKLLKIKNRIDILGNHDDWASRFYQGVLNDRQEYELWFKQGGKNTQFSYGYRTMPSDHLELLMNAKLYHIINNKLFVHAGFDCQLPMDKQTKETLIWDRQLIQTARTKHYKKGDMTFGNFTEIFIGHTTTQLFKEKGIPIDKPVKYCNVWMMDTGGGFNGKVSIMNIDTHEVFQSDYAKDLYPGWIGR